MIVIREDGASEVFEGARHLALEALQAIVGGLIEVVAFRDGSAVIVNEEGLLLGMEYNPAASIIAMSKGRGMRLVGPVAFLTAAEVRSMEDDDA